MCKYIILNVGRLLFYVTVQRWNCPFLRMSKQKTQDTILVGGPQVSELWMATVCTMEPRFALFGIVCI